MPSFQASGPEAYPIDQALLDECTAKNIWDTLSMPGFRGQDLIYASIAYIENIPLVTTDQKMAEGLKDVIRVELITKK